MSRIQNFFQGKGLIFFLPGGGTAPVGAWKPLEIRKFYGGGANFPSLNAPLSDIIFLMLIPFLILFRCKKEPNP